MLLFPVAEVRLVVLMLELCRAAVYSGPAERLEAGLKGTFGNGIDVISHVHGRGVPARSAGNVKG